MANRERRALRKAQDERSLLERILDTPQLAQLVPRLQPEVLHRVIQSCGLEDCGAFVALATSDQLARVFDLDLWRARKPGQDEELDADRFGVWLDVLMDSGAEIAAQKLVGIDVAIVTAALARHVRVFDRAAVSRAESPDGDEVIESRSRRDSIVCDVGSYLVEARRTDAWDTIIDLLLVLDAEHPDYFHRVMRGCRQLSNSGHEIDGLHDLLDDSEQDTFDLGVDRETRRAKQGYITPAQARAFLQMARQLELEQDTAPFASPIARAYFQAIESPPSAAADAAVMDVLIEAGVVAQPPRALLEGPDGPARRTARIEAHMQSARDADYAAFAMKTEEFAYLANSIVAGCTIQGRSFTPREASDAVAAVCNLGLENWPTRWSTEKDLISVFQVGWTVLHTNVTMYAAERLIELLSELRNDDREIQAGLDALQVEMARQWRAGAPWRARDALDVIVILDQPAWAVLLGLIAECPVLHGAVGATSRTRAVSASAFEFISENRQIASVREFFRSLKDKLRG
jgi:hypothetical protein